MPTSTQTLLSPKYHCLATHALSHWKCTIFCTFDCHTTTGAEPSQFRRAFLAPVVISSLRRRRRRRQAFANIASVISFFISAVGKCSVHILPVSLFWCFAKQSTRQVPWQQQQHRSHAFYSPEEIVWEFYPEKIFLDCGRSVCFGT